MNNVVRAAACLLITLLPATYFLVGCEDGNTGKEKNTITVFCAANLNKPVSRIAAQYRQETGVEVLLQPGPTGILLSQLEVARRGDLLITADEDSMEIARSKGFAREVSPLVTQRPAIAVASGNPKGIKSIQDLLRSDVKLALCDPSTASIGKVSRRILGKTWDTLDQKKTVMKTAVTEVASDVQIGAVDAAIVWDSTVSQFSGLEAVSVPEFSQHVENACVAVLAFSVRNDEAVKFARYLVEKDHGAKVFQATGFKMAELSGWMTR